ncbi:MAG TPA: FHA domain-containing protein [Gaiellaceae bacterium]
MTLASLEVGEALLILKILFLLLLYLFIWRIVRTASRDLRLPQESFVLAPDQAARLLGGTKPVATGRIVFPDGHKRGLDSRTVSVGRSAENDIPLEDDFTSARHARIEPRRDGVWVSDAGSTNGTYVNGAKLSKPHRLKAGDVIRVGNTDLRYER